MSTPVHRTRRWRELSEHLRQALPPYCHVCGVVINLYLPYTHRMSWTLDHVVPVAIRPDLAFDVTNLRPAHSACTQRMCS